MIAVMNFANAGHCRNLLFEKRKENGGDGHENLIKEYVKPTGQSILNCALIYGYRIKNGEMTLNSCTFNGHDVPYAIRDVFPTVFEKTRSGEKIREPLTWRTLIR